MFNKIVIQAKVAGSVDKEALGIDGEVNLRVGSPNVSTVRQLNGFHSVGPHSFKPRSLEPYPLSRIRWDAFRWDAFRLATFR